MWNLLLQAKESILSKKILDMIKEECYINDGGIIRTIIILEYCSGFIFRIRVLACTPNNLYSLLFN